MIIDASNKEIINTKAVYYHDDVLTGFTFDRARKKLRLTIAKFGTEKRTKIIFENVIQFTMSACEYWGSMEHILGFCLLRPEQEELIPKIFKKRVEYDDCPLRSYEFCTLKSREVYFETAMTFASGDELLVACERIVLERSELENAAE